MINIVSAFSTMRIRKFWNRRTTL